MKTTQLCKDFLRMRRGETFTSLSAAQKMEEIWGIYPERSTMAMAIEYLVESKEATLVGSLDNRVQVIIN